LRLQAELASAKIPVQIDVGFGDAVRVMQALRRQSKLGHGLTTSRTLHSGVLVVGGRTAAVHIPHYGTRWGPACRESRLEYPNREVRPRVL
jgi:hypothetical protein